MATPQLKQTVSPQRPFNEAQQDATAAIVLIAEDHEDTRALLRYVMERQGRRVVEAADGEQAVLTAQVIHPDLILMDAGMPGTDGLVATQKIREDVSLHDVPIVFLTGHVQPRMQDAAFASGVTAYLKKPVSIEELENVVAKLLQSDDH